MSVFSQRYRFTGTRIVPCYLEFDKLVFLHVEKTAGMTTRRILCGLFGNGDVSPHSDKDDFEDYIASHPVLVGHVDYAFVTQLIPSFGWFTFLRDPVERAVSLMNYWAFQVQNQTSHWTDGSEIEREAYHIANSATFEAFISSPNEKIRRELQNHACWRITGRRQEDLLDEEYAALAFKRVREEAIFFGLQEHYPLSLLQIPILMNIDTSGTIFPHERINQVPNPRLSRVDVQSVDRSVLGADVIFFNHARELFHKRMEALIPHVFQRLSSKS
jgi:hypothetical protein